MTGSLGHLLVLYVLLDVKIISQSLRSFSWSVVLWSALLGR